jgi:hypothetical protein
MRQLLITLLFFGCTTVAFPQTAVHHKSADSGNEVHIPHFRAAFIVGHTLIPALESQENAAIPSYGLDVEYWPTSKIGFGIHNDLEITNFIIETDHEEYLEREYPLVVTADLLIKPWKGLVIQAGPGIEFEKNENFLLFRLGLEYEFELNHHWDLFPTLFYDDREGSYHTWSIGLGVGKRF